MSNKYTEDFPYAEGDQWLKISTVCLLLNVSESTLKNWLKQADAPPYDHKYKAYSARQIGEWIRMKQTLRPGVGKTYPYRPANLVEKQKTSLIPAAVTDNTPNYDKERARKERAQADKVEMENEITRGSYIAIEEVETAWSAILSRVKTRVMQIPYTGAMMVVGDAEISSVQEKLKQITTDALMELSTDWREGDADDEGDD